MGDLFDRNYDGVINRREFEQTLQGGVAAPQAAPMAYAPPVATPLTYTAAAPAPMTYAAPAATVAPTAATAVPLFDLFDRNHDGVINRREFEQTLQGGVAAPQAAPMAYAPPVA